MDQEPIIKRGATRIVENGVEVFITSDHRPRWIKIRPGTLEDIKKSLIPISLENVPEQPGIYLFSCIISDERSYVGESLILQNRVYEHCISEKRKINKQVIDRAIKSYGCINFEIRLLEVFDIGAKTKDELLDLEEAYIAYYKLLVTEMGYNIVARGRDRTGYRHSEETKNKMSKAKSGENHPNYGKRGSGTPMYGKNHTQDSRNKMSNASTGRKCSQETREKMSLSRSGEQSYMYGKKHSQEIKDKISKAHLGKKFSEETRKKISSAKKIAVDQLNKDTGELIQTWPSGIEAGIGLSIHSSSIGQACKGKIKSSGGFQWRYTKSKA